MAGLAQGVPYQQMGERLRIARQARGLTLRELAERLAVSPSMISQIETGRASPSVSTLYSIATELDVSLDDLLFNDRRTAAPSTPGKPTSDSEASESAASDSTAPESAPGNLTGQMLQHSQTRRRIRLASGVIWERLTPLSEPDTEFLYVTYEVGGASSPEDAFQRHAGHEWGFVLEGTLAVKIGFDEHVLHAGDSISFASTIPHRLANIGDTVVHAVWFVLGRGPVGHDDLVEDLHVPLAATSVGRAGSR